MMEFNENSLKQCKEWTSAIMRIDSDLDRI